MNQKNDIAEQQQAMMRHRRRVAHARTPLQQWEISQRLQTAAMETILQDPAAYDAFVLRNHRKRTSDKVARLEAKLMRERE